MNFNKQTIVPFFTFKGEAEAAMNYYVSFFPDAQITNLDLYGDDGLGEAGKVLNGTLETMGASIMFMDLNVETPDFSWATTLLLNCRSEAEFDTLFDNLAKDGLVMMGPEAVLDIKKVAWVTDKFGVTWQLVFK